MPVVQINAFFCTPDGIDPVRYLHPQPGDVVWIKLDEETDQTGMMQAVRSVNEALDFLGLKGQVAVIVSRDPHDLSTLDDDGMEGLGWVRKKGTR